jgi:UDP-2,3-diacylglucosamine hydrolase
MARKLGVLAGRGPLPAQVVAAARAQGTNIFVLAFEGETDPELVRDLPHRWVTLGAVGRAIDALRAAQVEDVVLIGPVRRPALTSLGLDRRGMQLLARLGLRRHGDDQLLRLIVEELENEGFQVVGADTLIAGALAPEGPMTALTPDADAMRDIELGIEVAERLGDLDIGQAAVVQQGLVLGVEAVEGTDALLARCAVLRRAGRGGVLVKVKKPGQERRADLPTIGPQTIRLAAETGIAGIAVQAGHCLIVERAEAIAAADRAGLFVIGVARP